MAGGDRTCTGCNGPLNSCMARKFCVAGCMARKFCVAGCVARKFCVAGCVAGCPRCPPRLRRPSESGQPTQSAGNSATNRRITLANRGPAI